MQNYTLRMAGSILEKIGGFSEKFWIKTEILLNSGGLRVYLPKTEGLLCKSATVDRYGSGFDSAEMDLIRWIKIQRLKAGRAARTWLSWVGGSAWTAGGSERAT